MRFWRQYVETKQLNLAAVVGEVTLLAEPRTAVLGVQLAFRQLQKSLRNPTVDWPEYVSNIASRRFVSISWASCFFCARREA